MRLLLAAILTVVAYAQVEIKDLDALNRHAEQMGRLIREDPAQAVSLALPAAELESLRARFPQALDRIETRGEWAGPLTVLVQENLERGLSRTVRRIRIEGRTVEVHWPDGPESSCSSDVKLHGIRLGDHIAVEKGRLVPELVSASPCTVTGRQNVAVLLVNYKSTKLPVWLTNGVANNAFFGAGWSMDGFWRENSFGVTTAAGSVFGPFNLPADYTCDQTDALADAVIQAADATIDLTTYTRLFIVAPSTPDCWWAGLSTVGCAFVTSSSKGYFSASLSWIMVSFDQTQNLLASVVSHESGHGFGLNHARSLDFDTVALGPPDSTGHITEYGDVFSAMAAGVGHWAAPHRNFLGWFSSSANVQQVEAPGTFTVQPYEIKTASPQALRIRRGAGNNQWLWLEYRQPTGTFDSALPATAFDGATIHFEDDTKPSDTYTYLLDFNASHQPNDFDKAPLKSGSTWSDPYTPLTLTIGNATSSGLSVSVAYDSPCAKISGGNSLGPQAQSGVITITAPDTCAWTAAAVPGSPWLTINGTATGKGNGSVAYSLEANTTGTSRTAVIYVDRQPFTVTQQVTFPTLTIAMTHSGQFAPGGTGTFAITVTNTGSAATATPVGVKSTPGPGLAIAGYSGAGWTCSGTDVICWRSDALSAAQSYPPLVVTVTVAMDAPATLSNQANAMLADAGTVVASTSDVIVAGTAADLTLAMTHTANFMQGDSADTYTLLVTNVGVSATTDPVSVLVSPLPVGLTATALTWDGSATCSITTLNCSRTGSLAPGQSYPPITLTVKVSLNAPSSVTPSATASGGGQVNTSNDRAADVTKILPHRRPRSI